LLLGFRLVAGPDLDNEDLDEEGLGFRVEGLTSIMRILTKREPFWASARAQPEPVIPTQILQVENNTRVSTLLGAWQRKKSECRDVFRSLSD